ncbi:unnamed protein product [Caenorhabditis sp. 36 PRJEB53466]|nr:unnamed protein product [Caenorhabditis sp. 36 PRJEB53466]
MDQGAQKEQTTPKEVSGGKEKAPKEPPPKDIIKESPKEFPSGPVPADVRTAKYYHGMIPRVDAEAQLHACGDYLLRRAESNQGMFVVLSIKRESGFCHIPLSLDKETKHFFFDPAVKEPTVTDVIGVHISRGLPVNVRWNICLKKPIHRPVWLLRHDDVTLVKKIGAGAFGEVFLARMLDPTSEYQLDCAVKTMKQEASTEAKLRFFKEARMMRKNYRHNNIVMIFGMATLSNPLLIVMELCPNGSLISYLRKNKGKVSALEKLRFIYEAASGLAYLESQRCIHRDVAARNCLLSAKNDIKISDFGLADDRVLVVDHSLDKLPIKWLAPETMQEKIYSLKSDIWAFGIMVWETYADGDEPYPGLSNVQARAKIVAQDYRMPLPEETPPEVVAIVDVCWDKNPDKRRQMSVHATALLQIYEAKAPAPYLSTAPSPVSPSPIIPMVPLTPTLTPSTDPSLPPSEILFSSVKPE